MTTHSSYRLRPADGRFLHAPPVPSRLRAEGSATWSKDNVDAHRFWVGQEILSQVLGGLGGNMKCCNLGSLVPIMFDDFSRIYRKADLSGLVELRGTVDGVDGNGRPGRKPGPIYPAPHL